MREGQHDTGRKGGTDLLDGAAATDGDRGASRAFSGDRLRSISIGFRLAAVVLITGCVTFGVIGTFASFRLEVGLHEQASALQKLSERQLSEKLESEALLARARIDMLFSEADRQVEALAHRPDVINSVATQNDITIRELFEVASVGAGLDVLLAVNADGFVVGANRAYDLMAVNDAVRSSALGPVLSGIVAYSTRVNRGTVGETRPIGDPLGAVLGVEGQRLGRVTATPIFDDFGDTVGILIGIRLLAPVETTLEQFAALARVGVIVLAPHGAASHAGPGAESTIIPYRADDGQLLVTADRANVARCAEYREAFKVCAFTDASVIEDSQAQMFKIGAQQSQSMMAWFLILAAVSLLGSVGALLVSVRYVTRGLPQLSRAAASVAKGELDVPFAATGVGEVRSLAVAFETMLSNLQSSLGQIRQLAYFDPVTGLSNREKIRLDAAALLRAAAPSDAVAFLFIDLNRFKSINDTFSHKVGDQLLAKVAERMRDFFESLSAGDLRGEPLMARLGGDEFLVVLRADRERSDVTELVERLLDVLREPYEIGPARMMAGASIGVSLYPFHGDDYETLLMSADVAMYVAKRRGGSNCVFFTADAAEIMQERLAIENDLKIAVRDRRLEVHYQPKVSCTTGRIVGVEALARWQHPKRDYVSPSKFIAIAEEAGLVPDIGLFVLERSIEDFARVLGGAEPVSLAVNVSVIQLEDLNFAAALDAILQRTGFPPTLLELEITESMAMRNSDVVQDQIAQLRALGIRFAIDDFGTGYSNLATLARLPVDVIKLDRSLVADLPASAEKQTIVRTILGLARSFGFSTVAEGVETQDELDYVVREGVDIAQGYLFSPAVPISTLLLLLQPSGLVDVIRSLSPAGNDRRRIAPASG